MSASVMRVHIDKIGPEGFEIDTRLESQWLAEMMLEAKAPFEPAGDGRLVVRLDRVGDDVVHARGRVTVSLSAPCGRCLESLRYDINVPIEVALFPHGSEPVSGADGELDADDLGVSTYEHKEVDLTGIVRDEIFLEMPMNPVCAFAEARACPNYQKVAGTIDLPIDEEPRPGQDPRWAALKSIKLS